MRLNIGLHNPRGIHHKHTHIPLTFVQVHQLHFGQIARIEVRIEHVGAALEVIHIDVLCANSANSLLPASRNHTHYTHTERMTAALRSVVNHITAGELVERLQPSQQPQHSTCIYQKQSGEADGEVDCPCDVLCSSMHTEIILQTHTNTRKLCIFLLFGCAR